MKKIVFALGVIASALILTSCASKDSSVSPGPAVAPEAAVSPAHDFKGEVGK